MCYSYPNVLSTGETRGNPRDVCLLAICNDISSRTSLFSIIKKIISCDVVQGWVWDSALWILKKTFYVLKITYHVVHVRAVLQLRVATSYIYIYIYIYIYAYI